jgi:hypothetical protein
MLLGLVLFGISTFYMQRRGKLEVMSVERAQLFTYIFVALVAAALGGLIFIRSRLAAADIRRIFALYMVGYALAESAALFAGVAWFIGGARELFIAGLVLMIVAFQVLPIRRDS